ncbi:MAG: peptidylprolyl isomerase [Desulfobacterium sp.]|jgi:peptidyl-prolyl cis-trans isomerase B (cyclophilin B)|nr:peptidylprolyl isomerase [Desulfobacterium sp.]
MASFKRQTILFIVITLATVVTIGMANAADVTSTPPVRAVMETTKGTIVLDLYDQEAPYTVANFINLSHRGYYNGLTFHRVIDNFMVQGGCPQGTGRGGPGYKFQDEFVRDLVHDRPGILSMANAGPGTNGSQFFITHVPTPWLNSKHTIFGSVADNKAMAVVNAIKKGDKILSITIEGDTSRVMAQCKDKVEQWNLILDKKFPAK